MFAHGDEGPAIIARTNPNAVTSGRTRGTALRSTETGTLGTLRRYRTCSRSARRCRTIGRVCRVTSCTAGSGYEGRSRPAVCRLVRPFPKRDHPKQSKPLDRQRTHTCLLLWGGPGQKANSPDSHAEATPLPHRELISCGTISAMSDRTTPASKRYFHPRYGGSACGLIERSKGCPGGDDHERLVILPSARQA